MHFGDVRMTTRRARCAAISGASSKRVAAHIPFAEELLAAYYCAFDRDTPLQVKATLVGALAYFVLPVDAIPDVLPVIGFTDDAAVLADRDQAGRQPHPPGASRGGAQRVARKL